MSIARGTVNLVNPPSAPGTTANREGAAGLGTVYPNPGAFLYPPHTLATVAAVLGREGWRVRAFDAVVSKPGPELVQAEAVGVFVSYATLSTDLAYLSSLRQVCAGVLFAFGPAMRFLADKVLTDSPVDAVLAGEAEGFCDSALQQLLRVGARHRRVIWPADVSAPGSDAEGWVTDLDSLPFPSWDLLPLDRYELLTVQGSRGCPDQCAYCPYAAAQGHRLRLRGVAPVVEELFWLERRFAPARVVFRDPVFAYDEQRTAALCEGMIRRGLRLRWECESRPEHLTSSLLRLMQRAGCQWIKIGLETTDVGLLHRLGRLRQLDEGKAYLQDVVRVVETCKQIGLNCRVFVMAGMPGQSRESTARTREFIARVAPVALNVKACEAYPGTRARLEPPSDVSDQLAELSLAQSLQPRAQGAGAFPRVRRWLKRRLRRS